MTFEQANNMIDDISWSYGGKSITKDDMIACREKCHEALKKQIPEKPDLEGDGYDENGELIYDTGYCPDCRHEFEVYYDAPKHCPDCGKALDWSDIDERE